MDTNSIRCTRLGCAVIAFAALASSTAWAGVSPHENKDAPVVLAQASTTGTEARPAVPASAFPAYQRGVRQAAAVNNEALRRYIWRTRMIHHFYYDEFASKE